MDAAIQSDIRTVISDNLQSLMKQKGISRKKICEDLDIKYTTFCDWVNGNTSPKIEALEDLSNYFEVEITTFLERSAMQEVQAKRVLSYAEKTKELDMKILDYLSEEQLKELLKSGFRFEHKTLEERIAESGGELVLSEQFDWGQPVGRELW